MFVSGYPVEAGLADSLAKPGKNITGNAAYALIEIWSKLLRLLREVKPEVQRVGVLWTYVPPAFPKEEIEPAYKELGSAEQSLGLKVDIIEVTNTAEMSRALAHVEATKAGALLLTSTLSLALRAMVMEFAVTNRLPTITDLPWKSLCRFIRYFLIALTFANSCKVRSLQPSRFWRVSVPVISRYASRRNSR
jgi:putative tryptophan/tyrosine transport system substrate-binding protein